VAPERFLSIVPLPDSRAGAAAPAPPSSEEDPLIERARRGDEIAIATLVRMAAPTALGAARRVTGDPALAEDAAQEAFLRAFRALLRYRPGSSFRAWVRTIAIRCAIDLMRRRRPESTLTEVSSAGASEEARHEDADLLREALRGLSPVDREIMLAREIEGVSDREISRRLDISVGAVRVRMHRARRRIRQRFQREERR
jgi:RNA polymerase sigma-70 factor (ECF subfamily)